MIMTNSLLLFWAVFFDDPEWDVIFGSVTDDMGEHSDAFFASSEKALLVTAISALSVPGRLPNLVLL